MRIRRIEIDNFRAYGSDENKPFILNIENKPIVVVYGNNGLGKSSLYDAIEWGITGKIERYDKKSSEKNDYLILKNHFTERKKGYVEIEFDNNFKIKREIKKSGKSDYNEGILCNNLDKNDILNNLVSDEVEKKNDYLDNFNVSHLLSQELLNSFIREKKDSERYGIFLTLYGLNVINNQKELIDKKIKEELIENRKQIEKSYNNVREKISNEKNKLIFGEDIEEILFLENQLKDLFPYIDINSAELKKLNIKLLSEKNKDLVVLKKAENTKEILKKEKNYNSINVELLNLKKEIEQMKDKIKKIEKYKLIKEIEKNMIEYKEYLKLFDQKNESEKEQVATNFLYKKISELKEDKAILNYYREIEKEMVEKYLTNEQEIEKYREEIKKEKEVIDKIGEIIDKFLIASIDVLTNLNNENCPLCGNEEIDKESIIGRLNGDLEKQSNPTIIQYQNNIDNNSKKIQEIQNNNKNIINNLKIKRENDIKNILDKKKRIERYFENLQLLKIINDKVNEDLEKLNIKFEEYNLEKEKLEKEIQIENNLEAAEEIKGNISSYQERVETLDTEELKEYNKIKQQNINIIELEKEIEVLSNKDVNYDNQLKNISKLINLYENNEILKVIEKLKIEKEIFKSDLENVDKMIEDLKELKKYIDDTILRKVNNKSEEYENKIQYLYKILSPHRNFNGLKIRIDSKGGNLNNTLRIEVFDEENMSLMNNPAYLFSSAQINTLAIAIFLTFSLDNNWSKLDTILLDDPIQNMDDINVYNFTDIIRRISEKKQIIISTHDDRIKDFMITKFGEKNVQVVNYINYGEIS